MQNNVDGLLVTTNQQNNLNYLDLNIPVIALDRVIHPTIPCIYANNYEGGKLATKTLIERGCICIAHIRGPQQLAPSDERYRGFIEIVESANIDYRVIESGFHMSSSEQVVNALLDSCPEIDGIFASNDLIAFSVVKAALKRGISIPQDLQVIGFDGISFSQIFYPSITTIVQPIYEMGKLATELLIQLIEKKTIASKTYCLPVKLAERDTTK
jgi:LacI family transcriptional regulator